MGREVCNQWQRWVISTKSTRRYETSIRGAPLEEIQNVHFGEFEFDGSRLFGKYFCGSELMSPNPC
jgi:hypothetical protein